MVTVSVVLATHNEEENLASCLASIKDLADEIIVVDGSSTDKTVVIAKKYGAKVALTDNPPNFHINKQKAIDMATCDWILQLDADERVTAELTKEIKQVLQSRHSGNSERSVEASRISYADGRFWTSQNDKENINGYWLPRKNWFLGRFLKKGGQYPDYTLRLYRRNKGRLPQKDVHEQAVVTGKVGYLKHPLLHYPYKNFNGYLKKWNRYTDLIATQIKSELRNKSVFTQCFYTIGYVFIKPIHWFLTTYIRHKGFYDLGPGFVFSFFSALRFPVSYMKYLKSAIKRF